MTDVLLSGWCGFPALFGQFAEKFDFYTPFYDDISGVFGREGRNLVCWSTGANLALKAENIKFDNIILVAPFLRFTDFTPERVLGRMIKKFESDPQTVMADFMKACGCPDAKMPSDADLGRLKEGLEYLLDSGADTIKPMKNVTVIHGENDAVVNISSGEKIAETLGCELVRVKDCGHFVSPEIIGQYIK